MSDIPSSILRALGFLSRIPVSSGQFPPNHRAADDAHIYPIAGLFLSLPAALIVFAAAVTPAAAWLLAAMAVAVLVIITGALHEDGLGDVADGFFATQTKDRILEIMRDPHLGTFGMLALTLSVTFRIASLTILIGQLGAGTAALLLMGVETISRTAMVWHWHALPNARPDGKADRAGQPSNTQMWQAAAYGLAILLVLMLTTGIWFAPILAIIVGVISALLFAKMCRANIDGHTGDTIGATQQIVAITLLVTLAIVTSLTT